jgi:hypothetical protein
VLFGALLVALVPPGVAPRAAAGSIPGMTPSWCTRFGSSVVGWTGTKPDLPICGPGPNNGGTWSIVDLPGPYGTDHGYFNATEGFQCVELADRFLAVVDGLAPVFANGQQVAANYHAAYANTRLYVNGSPGSVAHPPVKGDVISFSDAPGFDSWSPGHVAVVSASSVDRATGDGTVTVSQENVGPGYWRYRLDLVDWRIEDPTTAPNAEWGFPYAEWLHVLPYRVAFGATSVALMASPRADPSSMPGVVGLLGLGARHRVNPGKLHQPRGSALFLAAQKDPFEAISLKGALGALGGRIPVAGS